jgi:outer membrane protein assembly factor BamB
LILFLTFLYSNAYSEGGDLVWEFSTGGGVSSSPAVSGEYVYVGSWDNKVYCLNTVTGAKIWEYTTGDRVESSPAVSGEYVYVGSYDNKVYCLDASTGVKKWEYVTGHSVASTPTVSGAGHFPQGNF